MDRVNGAVDRRADADLRRPAAGRAAVREHLASSSYVDHSRAAEPDEGGDAFTVFWIKD